MFVFIIFFFTFFNKQRKSKRKKNVLTYSNVLEEDNEVKISMKKKKEHLNLNQVKKLIDKDRQEKENKSSAGNSILDNVSDNENTLERSNSLSKDSSENGLNDFDDVDQASTPKSILHSLQESDHSLIKQSISNDQDNVEVIADFNPQKALVPFEGLVPLINKLNETEKNIATKLMEKIDNLSLAYLNLERRIDAIEKNKCKSYINLPFTDKEVPLFENSSFFVPLTQLKLATTIPKGRKHLKGTECLNNYVRKILPCLLSVENIYRYFIFKN